MAPVSARFCQEHESLIRWLQSWVTGNQEVGAPVNWGQVSVSKGAASRSAHLGAGPCRAKRYRVALTSRALWAVQGLGIEESSWWFLQLWMLSEMHVQGSLENDLKTFSSSGSSLNCLLDISSWMPHRYLGVILSPDGQELSAWHTMKYSKPHADAPEILIRWKNAFQKQKPPLSTWKQFHLWVALSVTYITIIIVKLFLHLPPSHTLPVNKSSTFYSNFSWIHSPLFTDTDCPRSVSFCTVCHSSTSWSKTSCGSA